MRKRTNSRQGLSSDERSWLDGEKISGFFQFKPYEDLEAIWLEYGDDSKMFWRRDMPRPITLEDLESREDEWLNSANNDEYGCESFFVYKHYNDDEKQALWAKRGDKNLYRWLPGMRKPQTQTGAT
jgi:hypothetical protein